jgi:V8-like Glu-specific endopeptidase
MKSAKPLPHYSGNGKQDKEEFLEDKQIGPPASVAGGLPGDNREKPAVYEDISIKNDMVVAGSSYGKEDMDDGTKDIFDDTYINQSTVLQRQYPFHAVGKLFMKLGSYTYSCSASVISAKDIIVTAAHCCYDRTAKKWFTNFSFVPAYRNGSGPYGNFGYTRARVLTAWISSGGRKNDVCLIRLNSDVSAKTGYLGRSWNYPIVQHHFTLGYPSNFSNGLYLFGSMSESFANCGDSLVYAFGDSMKEGSSGGPMIRAFELFKSGGSNYVNGVISGWDSCTGTRGMTHNGPRFTSNNIAVLCTDEGC